VIAYHLCSSCTKIQSTKYFLNGNKLSMVFWYVQYLLLDSQYTWSTERRPSWMTTSLTNHNNVNGRPSRLCSIVCTFYWLAHTLDLQYNLL
jgi:hypothetical protein